MGIGHFFASLFVADLEYKKNIINLISVSIFADSIVRKEERKKALEILENLFEGEDYEFLEEEIDLQLNKFQENPNHYIVAKDDAIDFINTQKKEDKANLILIVEKIFGSDYEVHNKEHQILNILKKGELL